MRSCVCMCLLRAVFCVCVLAKSTLWRCSVRSSQLTRSATVKQVDTTFVASTVGHFHPPTVGVAVAGNVSKDIKEKAKDNIFL